MSTLPQLKPMTAGDILDQAIRIYRENFVPLVTIVAIVYVPLILVQVVAAALSLPSLQDFSTTTPFQMTNALTLFSIASVITFILERIGVIFVQAAIAAFVSERFLGRPSSVRKAYGSALRRWLALLIAALLILLGAAGVVVLLVVIFFILFGIASLGTTSGTNTAAAAILGLVSICLCFLIIPAVINYLFFTTKWLFTYPAIVIENFNSTGGMGRSWKLTRGTFWRVVGFNLILLIIINAFALGPSSALSLGTAFLPSPLLRLILQSIVSSAIVIAMTPLQFATLTVLYYDIRIRKEGFDLQMQMQEPQTPLSDLPSLFSDTSS